MPAVGDSEKRPLSLSVVGNWRANRLTKPIVTDKNG
jgi:hypothetical protein